MFSFKFAIFKLQHSKTILRNSVFFCMSIQINWIQKEETTKGKETDRFKLTRLRHVSPSWTVDIGTTIITIIHPFPKYILLSKFITANLNSSSLRWGLLKPKRETQNRWLNLHSSEPWTLLSRSNNNNNNNHLNSSRHRRRRSSRHLLWRRRKPEAVNPSRRTRKRTNNKLRRWKLNNNLPLMSVILSGSLLFLFSMTGLLTIISFGLLSLAGTLLT